MNLYEYQRSRSFIDLCPRSLKFNIFKLLFFKNIRPIDAIFHVEPSYDGRMKLSTNGFCHTQYQDDHHAHICYKIFKIFFSRTERPMNLKLGMQHRVLEYYQVYSNAPGLTLTYFTARSNLVRYVFVWNKVKTLDFSEIIVVYDIKVDSCSN